MTEYKAPIPDSWEDARPLSRYPAHEARESAIRILTDAYAYDAITEVEFERRLGRLSVADSRAALDAISPAWAAMRMAAFWGDVPRRTFAWWELR